MKEMTLFNIIESNENLRIFFIMAGKLKKMAHADIFLKTILTGNIEGKRGSGQHLVRHPRRCCFTQCAREHNSHCAMNTCTPTRYIKRMAL